jgi:predicted PurR-regulated permease PerM
MSLLIVPAVLLIALGVWVLVLISWRSYQRFKFSLDRWDAVAQQIESWLPSLAEEVQRSNRDWQSLTQEARSSLNRANRVLEILERLATTVELLLIAGLLREGQRGRAP